MSSRVTFFGTWTAFALTLPPLGACGAGPGCPAHCSTGYPSRDVRSRSRSLPLAADVPGDSRSRERTRDHDRVRRPRPVAGEVGIAARPLQRAQDDDLHAADALANE